MRRFCLVALTAGILLPNAAKADTYWLVFSLWRQHLNAHHAISTQKVPMKNEEQCLAAATKVKDVFSKKFDVRYVCLKGVNEPD